MPDYELVNISELDGGYFEEDDDLDIWLWGE